MLISSIPQYIQGVTNAKVDLTTTDLTNLFTVPSDADFNAAVVNSILVAEDSGNADTITVQLVSGSDTFVLFEILKVQAATANRLHVVASIQELSKTRVTTSALSRI